MEKLLIADPSPEFCAAVIQAAAGLYDVRCCGDGATALELAITFRPRVLVLALELPELDGCGVIEALDAHPDRPKILVTAGFMSDYVQSFLTRPSVSYAMLKPCSIQALLCHVERLARPVQPVTVVSARSSAEALLFHLGVPLRSQSGQCVLAAVERYLQDPTLPGTWARPICPWRKPSARAFWWPGPTGMTGFGASISGPCPMAASPGPQISSFCRRLRSICCLPEWKKQIKKPALPAGFLFGKNPSPKASPV